MHVLPPDLQDVGRHLYIRGGFMVNLCMIIESMHRSLIRIYNKSHSLADDDCLALIEDGSYIAFDVPMLRGKVRMVNQSNWGLA